MGGVSGSPHAAIATTTKASIHPTRSLIARAPVGAYDPRSGGSMETGVSKSEIFRVRDNVPLASTPSPLRLAKNSLTSSPRSAPPCTVTCLRRLSSTPAQSPI